MMNYFISKICLANPWDKEMSKVPPWEAPTSTNIKRQVLFQEFSALKMNPEEELTPTMADCWEREIGALKRKENKMMLGERKMGALNEKRK
jgi:hypothetical protein